MFKILYTSEVVSEQIPKLSAGVSRKIKKAVEKKLAIDPVAYGKPLRRSLKGLRRLRVEDYRVIYKIDHDQNQVIILMIGHRKDAYE